MSNTGKSGYSHELWAPDFKPDPPRFNLSNFIKTTFEKRLVVPPPILPIISNPKQKQFEPHEYCFVTPKIFSDNIILLHQARAVNAQIDILQHKLSNNPNYKPFEKEFAKPDPIQYPNVQREIPFKTSYPDFDDKSIQCLKQRAIMFSLVHAGFDKVKESAMQTLSTFLDSFFTKFCTTLKTNFEYPALRYTCGFSDPKEHTLRELDLGGYQGLYEFWHENVINFGVKLEKSLTKLEAIKHILLNSNTNNNNNNNNNSNNNTIENKSKATKLKSTELEMLEKRSIEKTTLIQIPANDSLYDESQISTSLKSTASTKNTLTNSDYNINIFNDIFNDLEDETIEAKPSKKLKLEL